MIGNAPRVMSKNKGMLLGMSFILRRSAAAT
jgi:hypothetical protein